MADAQTFADFAEEAKVQRPDVALVLGSGLSGLADRCRIIRRLPFLAVPGLAATSVTGHTGCVLQGEWAGKRPSKSKAFLPAHSPSKTQPVWPVTEVAFF